MDKKFNIMLRKKSFSGVLKTGTAAAAYSITWAAILLSLIQGFLVYPSSSWAVTGSTTLTVVPAAPTTLAAVDTPSDNGKAINLSWTPSVTTGVTEQRVYRGTTTGGPYGALVTTIANNTTSSYTDITGLTNGTTYYYVVRAFGGGQESGNSNEASAVPVDNVAPAAPAVLSAADVAGDNGGAIVLNWTVSTSTDVTQQRIYRGTVTGGPYGTLVTTISNNTISTYTDNSGLTNGTTYYYVIRSYDGTQESVNSNESSAIPINNPPNPPSGVSASDVTGDNGGAIALTWTVSASTDVTQQRIYRATVSGGPYGTLVTTISNNTTSTYTDNTGLTNGTTYYYVIRTYDGTQESVNSNEGGAAPVDNTAPNAPAGLSAADVAGDNGGAIVLTWTVSASTDVTQQRIYRGTTAGGPYPTLVTTIANNTTATYTENTGLTNGTTYYYVIRAYDGTQESGNSNQGSAAPIDNPPNPPTGVSAADVAGDNGGAIALNWTVSASTDVTQQRIYRGTVSGGPYGTLVTTISNNTTSTYSDNTGLTNGTTYYYVIRTYDGTQESGNSNQGSAAPVDNTAPNAPAALSAADVAGDNGGAIVLNWTVSTSTDVTQQRIYRGSTAGGPYPTLVTTLSNNTTATYTDNTGLTNGTTYYYVIRAYDGTQESVNSNQGSASPVDNIAPNAPAALSAADVAGDNGGAIVLNWTVSASTDVTQQRIYRGTVSGGPYGTLVTTISNNTTSTYTDNTGLTNGTTYYYVIRAYDGTQESGNSNQGSAAPVDNTAPNAPAGLSA
ncbi:MAG: fibronectin type III domain-containing protein, partial [Nitrospirae bacterium]|nr:fibronectin type III domain-containing protein [Nitrospirota bacterium]